MNTKLIFTDSNLTVEQRYELISSMLNEHECVINFKKKDGELRTMSCTLRDDMLPVATQIIKEDVAAKPITFETLTVWSTENQAWRAMKTMNIIDVDVAPKKWTVTVEEDPETGDLILPLPDELLKMQGWNNGDTLSWDKNEDGSWIISKKDNDNTNTDDKS